MDSEFGQFTYDSRCSPCRIGAAHGSDQFLNFRSRSRPTGTSLSAFARPKLSESILLPIENGSGPSDDQNLLPTVGDFGIENPEKPISVSKLRPLGVSIQNRQLLAQGQVLQGQILPTLEQRNHELVIICIQNPMPRRLPPIFVSATLSASGSFQEPQYAREASVALMGWARQTQGVRSFAMTIRPDNHPSQALAAQLGFVRIASHIDEVDGLEDILEYKVSNDDCRTAEPQR